jgi:adenylate cyclase
MAAKGALAGQLVFRVTQNWGGESDVEEGVRHARDVVEEGGEDDPTALAWAGHALTFLGRDYGAGFAATERARLLAPSSGQVLFAGAWNRIYAGDWRTAVEWTERAIRLSPVDPSMFHFMTALGAAHFLGEQCEGSVLCCRRAINGRPTYLVAHRWLVAGLAQLGRVE